MNIIAKFLLFVFISFLSTPLIISVIEREIDISALYSFSEEEKMQKEIKAIISCDATNTASNFSQLNYTLIFSKNNSKHSKISSKIFIPPPKQV